MRKWTGLLLSLVLLGSLLAGCSGKHSAENSYVYQVTGGQLSSNDEILSVNGKKINAQYFLYWLGNSIDYIEAYTLADNIDWSQEYEGRTMEDYLIDDAVQAITQYQVILDKAKEYGYKLEPADEEELANTREYYVDYFGGEEAYQRQLASEGLDEELFAKLNTVPILYRKIYAAFLSADGPFVPSDEEFSRFLSDNGYIRAKHILLSTQDDEGNPLSDVERSRKYQEAKDILFQLNFATDLEETFDTLMQERSEDNGLTVYPGGYTFRRGEMVAPFEDTAYSMEPGQLSEIVESDFGYHIILREPLDMELAKDDPDIYDTFLEECFSKLLTTWWEDAKVVRYDALDKVDVQMFYEARAKLREEAQAELENQGLQELEVENTQN